MSEEKVNIKDLLKATKDNGASDLHLSSGLPPMLRLNGEIEYFDLPSLSGEDIREMITELSSQEQIEHFDEHWELDMSYQLGDVARFRVNVFLGTRGPGIVFRTIPTEIVSLEKLGAPEVFKQIAEQPRGIVLVTGPTGSGKSTTLAAMINEINVTRKEHILTIEDPVEFVHKPKKSLINQREIGSHTKSFANSLRAALREDPDIILVGEMRDPETIGLALTAAETGHLVFGTLHTSSAAKTIDRVIDVFPAGEKEMIRSMLSESLRAVISQSLMRRVGGGRVAAHEIMISTPSIRNLIRENKVPQMYSVIQTGMAMGMQTLDQSLKDLVDKNLVTKETAISLAVNKEDFR
jgi:twitching motility protein PilT